MTMPHLEVICRTKSLVMACTYQFWRLQLRPFQGHEAKQNPKRKNRGDMAWLGSFKTQCHQQCHPSMKRIRLPIHLSQKLSILSRYSELFVESRKFFPKPHVSGAPLGADLLEFHQDHWRRSPYAIARCCLPGDMFSCFNTKEHWLVTDGRTDRTNVGQ